MPPETEPPAGPTALPSVQARLLAFASILVGGVLGGLIGFGIVDVQCTGDCGTATGIGALVGAVVAAVGVGIVAVLVLRAMGEWSRIKADQTAQE